MQGTAPFWQDNTFYSQYKVYLFETAIAGPLS